MTTLNSSARLKLDNILAATDLSPASKAALLYAIPITRRHEGKVFIVHVSSSESPGNVLDAWHAAQTELMDYFMAGHFKGVRHELLVKAGDVWTVLSRLIADYGIDLIVVGTRGRTGVAKFLLGSVAERIFRQAPCPVPTIGPSISGEDPEVDPHRILVPTGFAPHSLYAVGYALWLAQELQLSSLALLHVVTEHPGAQDQERIRKERLPKRTTGLILYLRWVRVVMMLSARSRKNPVFLSGELPRVLGHYLASILAGYDGGACKP